MTKHIDVEPSTSQCDAPGPTDPVLVAETAMYKGRCMVPVQSFPINDVPFPMDNTAPTPPR